MRARPSGVASFVLAIAVSGSAIAQAPNDVAPPTGIKFLDPFINRDAVVTNAMIPAPDSVVFVDPFLMREGTVDQENVAPPTGVEFRTPFITQDGTVTDENQPAPPGLKFIPLFIGREGVVTQENVPPPDGIESRDPFIGRTGVAVAAPGATPAALLQQLSAAPNPFNPGTQLSFRLTAHADVTVGVYDASGRRVRTLHRGALDADLHVMRWDGNDDNGRGVASGVYVFRVEAGKDSVSLKAVLLK